MVLRESGRGMSPCPTMSGHRVSSEGNRAPPHRLVPSQATKTAPPSRAAPSARRGWVLARRGTDRVFERCVWRCGGSLTRRRPKRAGSDILPGAPTLPFPPAPAPPLRHRWGGSAWMSRTGRQREGGQRPGVRRVQGATGQGEPPGGVHAAPAQEGVIGSPRTSGPGGRRRRAGQGGVSVRLEQNPLPRARSSC